MTDRSTQTAAGRLPGDLTKDELIDRIIRVDHAGEFGAKRIYEGQLAVLRGKPEAQAIEHMYQQELEHLRTFEKLMVERRVRPSALHPLWNAAGFALGAATALLGPKAAMACTVAVEEVIDQHYRAAIGPARRRRGAAQSQDRQVPRRRAGAPRYRAGARRAAGTRLSAADRRDQGRVPAGDLAGGADLGPT